MISRLGTVFLLSLACASTIAWLVALMHEKNVRPVQDLVALFKKQSKVGRVILGTFFIAMWIFASNKPGDGGGTPGGATGTTDVPSVGGGATGTTGVPPVASAGEGRLLQRTGRPLSQCGLSPVADEWADFTPITSTNTTRTLTGDDFRRGFVLVGLSTNSQFTILHSPFSNAVVCVDWKAFGAAEDWTYANVEWRMENGKLWGGVLSNATTRLRIHSDGWFETGTTDVPPVGGGATGTTDILSVGDGASGATDGTSVVPVNGQDARFPGVFWPFRAPLGIAPEANWSFASTDGTSVVPVNGQDVRSPSRFWHGVTPSNTLQMTWQNVLLNRDANTPVSVQVELWPNGRFAYRYDLRNVEWRMENGELDAAALGNIVIGASVGSLPFQSTLADLATNTPFSILHSPFSISFHPLSPEDATDHDRDGDGLSLLDELFAFGTDPDLPDTDHDGLADSEELAAGTDPLDPHTLRPDVCDGYALAMGGLDPLAVPEGSTNTVLEHLFYTGTTNGTISLPQPSETHAVLSVSVSGHGVGELAVGDRVVPLFGREPTRSVPEPAPYALSLPVPRGRDVPVFLRGDGTLSVALDSSEFAFGTLPSVGAGTSAGFVNFPNTVATTPCIHDFNARSVSVTLPVGEGASRLACTWTGGDGVDVANSPPRSATISGSFPSGQTREISYTLSHPMHLFGRTLYPQSVRFCPRPDEEDEDDGIPWPEEGEGDSSYGDGGDEAQPHHLCGCADCGEGCTCGCWPPDGGPGGGGGSGAGEETDLCPDHGVPYQDCSHLHAAAYTNAVQTLPAMQDVLYIRDPPDWRDIHLDVPSGPRMCCPCLEHWQNYVEVAYKSRGLRLVDGAGLPFRRTGSSCTVRVAGTAPSRSAGDAHLAFAGNGRRYRSRRYTVLGVTIEGMSGPPVSRFNACNPSFGLPVAVGTNAQEMVTQLKLVTNVGLGAGNVHVEIADATGGFALWRPEGGGLRRMLDVSGAASRDVTMQGWRRMIAEAGLHGSAYLPVLVTSSSPGQADIVLRYWAEVDGRFVQDEVRQRVTSVPPPMMVDVDRDGDLGAGDVAAYLGGKTFRFWTNEDFWKGDDAFAGEDRFALNSLDMVVNGRNDLINLMPVAIDVSPFVDAWGSSATFRIRGSNAIRYVLADIDWNGMGQTQIDDCLTTGNAAIRTAQLSSLSATGHVLNPSEVELSENGSLTMLMEASQPCNNPVEIVVEVGGEEMFKFRPRIEFASVRNMYRWYNRRGVAGGEVTDVDRAGDPQGWPDEERDGGANGPMLVFVHGYNMAEWEARAWTDGVFKRLWWSGLNSKFAAVAWYGNDGQMYMPTEGLITPNYHVNVEHAFTTAPYLASLLNGLSGDKYILAHSLGNMVVSSAIQDHGLQCKKYFMLNAAVPVEAYDVAEGVTAESKAGMTHPSWTDYPDRVRASHWWELFPVGDGRRTLTWKGRFANVTNTVNYFSSEEEVLANGNGVVPTVGRAKSWFRQEVTKGIKSAPLITGRNEAGWEFNVAHMTEPVIIYPPPGSSGSPTVVEESRLLTPSETTNLTDAVLMSNPFFGHFQEHDIYTSSNGLIVATNVSYRAQLLVDAIPSESFAVGANNVSVWGEEGEDTCNVDMAEHFKDTKISSQEWTHSSFIGIPYLFVQKLYKNIIQRISMEEEQ